jgi:hypothetical protein
VRSDSPRPAARGRRSRRLEGICRDPRAGRRPGSKRHRGDGYDFVHAAVDDPRTHRSGPPLDD